MTRAEKAKRILAILAERYPAPAIPLHHDDPFTLLVAVVLSAQTTDERVNQVTPVLFARARTPAAMAKLSVAEILEAIRSCGLAPAKAKNIRALSEILVREHGGRVPADLEALEALPGVGHKTASVVLAQAFGRAAFPVDTHIHRLAARWGLSNGSSVERTERDLKALFPEASWSWLHLAIILFGREVCPARGHDLATCPICSFAASRKRIAEERRTGGGGPRSRARVAAKRRGTRALAANAENAANADDAASAARAADAARAKGEQARGGRRSATRAGEVRDGQARAAAGKAKTRTRKAEARTRKVKVRTERAKAEPDPTSARRRARPRAGS